MKRGHNKALLAKDYVEHLRSVHFTLVGVAIILAFLAFSPAPSQYEEAKKQLIEIQRIDRSRIEDTVYHQYQEALRSWNHSTSVTLLATDSAIMNVADLNKTFNISFKPPMYFIPEILGLYPSEPLDDLVDPHSFRSLMEFRKFWDSLQAHRTLSLPTRPPAAVLIESLARAETRIFEDPASMKEHPAVFSKGRPGDTTLEFELIGCQPAVKKLVLDRSHVGCHYMYRAFWPEGRLVLAIPIEEQEALDVEPQRVFLERNKDWVPGKFDSSFALLNQLSINIQDLHLEELRRVLETEATRKLDSFEVVGIKFPSETTKWAGFVVLCGVQLYFGLLLREQRLFRGGDSSGSEVAWIGFCKSIVAEILLFITIVLLPPFAFIAIALGRPVFHANALRIAGLIFASIMLVGFSILTWTSLVVFKRKLMTRTQNAEQSPLEA